MLVSDAFAQAHRLRPARITLTVAGHGRSVHRGGGGGIAGFLYQIRARRDVPGLRALYAIVWLNRRRAPRSTCMAHSTSCWCSGWRPVPASDVIAAVDRQLEPSVVAVPMVVASSCRRFLGGVRQLATIFKLFPTIFLAVAAFLLNVVFTRLIGIQRDQVAVVLKAFGYHARCSGFHRAACGVDLPARCSDWSQAGGITGSARRWLRLYQLLPLSFPRLFIEPRCGIVGYWTER